MYYLDVVVYLSMDVRRCVHVHVHTYMYIYALSLPNSWKLEMLREMTFCSVEFHTQPIEPVLSHWGMVVGGVGEY